MPKKLVNGINIMYEAYGSGDTVVYLQSTLGGLNPGTYFIAGRLSGNFRVIIWDGPNNGQSDVIIKQTPSECHLYCEYLKGLLDETGEKQVHIAGCSGGGEMALLFAHLYPDMVKSLAMYRPADTASSVEREIVKARYYDIAEAADISMDNAVKYSMTPPQTRFGHISGWLAGLYSKDSEKIMKTDNRKFAEIMREWGDFMGSPKFYRANLTDSQLRQIGVPVLIFPCPDDYHPESIAIDLHNNLPHSVYIAPEKYRKENEIYNACYDEHTFGGFVDFVNAYEKFLKQNREIS